MDDVVLELLRAELALALGLVAADRVCRLQVEASVEEALEDRDPGGIRAVMEGEREHSTGLEDPVGLAPARGQQALIVGVSVAGVARAIRYRLERLRRVF